MIKHIRVSVKLLKIKHVINPLQPGFAFLYPLKSYTQQMVFSLLLNNSYIYDIFLLGFLNQYSLRVRDSEQTFYGILLEPLLKSLIKNLISIWHIFFLWLNSANQWLAISPIIFSPNMQTCYNLQAYLYEHKCINLSHIALDFSWLECMTLS